MHSLVRNRGIPFCMAGIFLLALGCSGKGRNAASPAQGSSPAAAVSGTRSGTVYPVTVPNYALSLDGSVWRDQDQTFDAAPERVVVLTQGGAELLLRLGLGDWIVGVGAVSGSVDLEVAEAFSKLTVFSENYIGKEIVLGAQPDLVLGRAPLFAEADWGAGSVDELNRYGIRTYIQNTSRPGAIIEDLYRDITELGQIFDAGERAAIFIEELREREGGLRAAVAANRGPALSYAYLNRIVDGVPNAYAGNKDTFLASAMEILGLVNVFRDAQRDIIDLETLIAADPDMLLWFSYAGGPDVLHLRDELYANAALGGMKSIANRRIYIFDYNEFWGYSYRIFSVLEKLAANL